MFLIFIFFAAGIFSGCSRFARSVEQAPAPYPIQVVPWRVIDRAPPGKPGGTLRVAEFGSGPKTFNPIIANETSSGDILSQIFSSLLDVNFKTGKIVSGLAYRWEPSPDGKVWTVSLRKGLRWSDGEPLTADDVVFTFRTIYDSRVDNPNRDIAQVNGKPIQCKKVDDATLRFFLPRRYGPFLFLLSSIPVIPGHRLSKALADGTFSSAYGINTPPRELVSNGPFRIAKYVPQERVILERNPYYYAVDVKGQRLPYLDRIIVTYVPDMNTQFLKFLSREVDVFPEFPSKFYGDLLAEQKKGNYHLVDLGPRAETQFIVFNENPQSQLLSRAKYRWFTNQNFRLAVAYAVQRDTMIRLAHLGHGYPCAQDFLPTSPFHNPKVKPFPYNPEKSRQLLQQSGFTWKEGRLYDSEGNPVQFTLLTNSGNVERRIEGEIFRENLAQLGIQVDFHPVDFNELVSKLDHTYDWEAVEIGLVDSGGNIEPSGDQNVWLSSGFTHEWHPRQKKPATAWEAEIDRLVWEGTATLNLEARKKIYGRIEEILYREQVPMILTTAPADLYAFRNTIGNADPTSLGRFWTASSDNMLMSQVYINK